MIPLDVGFRSLPHMSLSWESDSNCPVIVELGGTGSDKLIYIENK
jgi:hypothetical protein